MSKYKLHLGDCLEYMKQIPNNYVDAIVTDPPYGLKFMGKKWDYDVPSVEIWQECYRILKPGGHLLSFAGTRTYHRLVTKIEDAGFEIRDMIAWIYGQGFPKSHNISKALDKMAGAERETIRERGYSSPDIRGNSSNGRGISGANNVGRDRLNVPITAPATEEAKQWEGWGTALKPAHEDLVLAMKPLSITMERDIIVENLKRLEAQLWSILPVNIAKKNFGLSQAEYQEVCDFAQWSAEERHNIWEYLLGQMDILQSVSIMNMCLNTVILWNNILKEALKPGSMFITKTEVNQTIDWKILKSYLLAITPDSIIQVATQVGGSWSLVLPAASYFHGVLANIASTLMPFAIESAILKENEKELPPNIRPICLARKPLEGTVAENILKYGTGGININGCKVNYMSDYDEKHQADIARGQDNATNGKFFGGNGKSIASTHTPQGRFPANVIHDGSKEVIAEFPQSNPTKPHPVKSNIDKYEGYGNITHKSGEIVNYNETETSAARFFYCAKASKKDRDEGLDDLDDKLYGQSGGAQGALSRGEASYQEVENTSFGMNVIKIRKNNHPTVKPTELMRYLCKLITPPNGIIIDPFMGSGSTGKAARLEGFRFIGAELDEGYFEIAKRRIANAIIELKK